MSAFVLLGGCASPGRDVVPESHDVIGDRDAPDGAAAPTPRAEGYAYVARRAHGAVGLVGAHFVSDADAQRLVDRVADELEVCARRLEASGTLVDGAVQLVAVAGVRTRGTAEISDVRFAPGGAVAANALQCIIAPLRAAPFPSTSDAGVPAVAIEATWSANRGFKTDAG